MDAKEAGRRAGAPPSDVAAPTRRSLRARRTWRLPLAPLGIAVAALIGAGLLLYPMVAAWFSQYDQSLRIGEYSEGVADLGATTLHERVADARAYNAALVDGGASIAAHERLPLAAQPDQAGDYAETLRADSDGLMARIKIPAIDVDLPVYHGTSDGVLEHGVGHLQGTALPVGGTSTHSVLTAHRGLATAELFTHLDRVHVDDTFTIEVFGEVLTYRVAETQVVEPEDTESLVPRQGEDLVTLVTCTPLGVNSHRILVTGERVIPTPQGDLDAAGRRPEIPRFPWWIVIAAGILVVLGAYVYLSGRPAQPAQPARAARAARRVRPAQGRSGRNLPFGAPRSRPEREDAPRTDQDAPRP